MRRGEDAWLVEFGVAMQIGTRDGEISPATLSDRGIETVCKQRGRRGVGDSLWIGVGDWLRRTAAVADVKTDGCDRRVKMLLVHQ